MLSLAVAFTSFSSVDSHYAPVSKRGFGGNGHRLHSLRHPCWQVRQQLCPRKRHYSRQHRNPLESGETAFDILGDVSRTYGIQVESTGTGGDNSLAYIKGINYIYEFDGGDLSVGCIA